MQVPYIKAAFEEKAYYLGEKLKDGISAKKDSYICDRLCAANAKIGDTLSLSRSQKVLNKVGEKASQDWSSMHKISNFVLKNSNKVAKGAIIGGAVAAVVAAGSLISHAVKNAKAKKA